jgi:hypothetical protein
LKIPPLPQVEGPKSGAGSEPELVAGSALFRQYLEALAGVAEGAGAPETENQEEEEPPKVKFKISKGSPVFRPEEILAGAAEDEQRLENISSTAELLDEPSILDTYRQRLVEHYGFSTEDPVFALCEIFDEAFRRDLKRCAASEGFCSELMSKAEGALAGLKEKCAKLENCVKQYEGLEASVAALGKVVERVEEIVLRTREEGAAQAASLALVQRDLERAVQAALQRGMVERVLMSVILVAALAVGILAGSHLLVH